VAASVALQVYATVRAYPLDGILAAVAAGFFGYLRRPLRRGIERRNSLLALLSMMGGNTAKTAYRRTP
jgi:hypothetical protein